MPQRTEIKIKTKTPNETKLAHIQVYALTACQPPKEGGGGERGRGREREGREVGEREGWRERQSYLFPSSY
jgi:hypothetical protein